MNLIWDGDIEILAELEVGKGGKDRSMEKRFTTGKKIVIVVVAVIVLILLLYFRFFVSMYHLPEGEYLVSSASPEGRYRLNVYISETSLSAPAIRGELEDLETQKTKNIYWDYRQETAEIEWMDQNMISINGHEFNYLTEVYDWRREE